MNKKGFLGDIGLIVAIMLLVSVVIIVGYKTFSSYNTKWQDMDVSNESKSLVGASKDRYVSLFDGIFMFVFSLLVIALFISATTISTKPEFFFITLIILVVFIGVGAGISNAYEDISTNANLNSTSNEFTFIPFIMGELPTVILLLGAVVMIGLYIKLS